MNGETTNKTDISLGMSKNQPPVFEFRLPDGKVIKVWPTGEVEGLDGKTIIVNRFPMYVEFFK